ncbi:MAG: polymer-forming cytoskeletal protein [Deltaproteobacteria bacterium]|nr:polymer-forming cytoskeletal protein [Deltaproteobacteria bacterium]
MSDNSFISAGQRVVGTISAAEDLVIVGRVEGRIQTEATVTIEGPAIVEADIHARLVVVRGVVVGEILGVDGIEIAPSGQVFGDLKTRRLALRAGGRVAGQVHSGIEVAPFVYGGAKAGTARGRVAAPSRSSWPTASEEVVETTPVRSQPSPAVNPNEARRGKKEPSREAI